jgi:hypothetical protein
MLRVKKLELSGVRACGTPEADTIGGLSRVVGLTLAGVGSSERVSDCSYSWEGPITSCARDERACDLRRARTRSILVAGAWVSLESLGSSLIVRPSGVPIGVKWL